MTIINPTFTEKNLERSNLYPNSENFTPEYFALALAEEAGEFCGALKKLARGFNDREALKINTKYEKYLEGAKGVEPVLTGKAKILSANEFWFITMRMKAAKELADLLTYIDLAATSIGIDLNQVTTEKWNEVSEEMKISIKL